RVRVECELVELPNRIAGERLGLLPPTVLFQKVHPTVTVHIAHTQAVGELVIVVVRRNRMPFPRPARVAPVRLGVAIETFRAANNLRFAVTGDVGESWRFVVRYVEHDVLLPVAFAALRV